MKKVLVVFLILVTTFPGEVAHAFSFVPEFISHYKHHNEEHHQVSLMEFVAEHFGSSDHDTQKHHEQDNCPVNHDHGIVAFSFVVEKKATFESIVPENIAFVSKKTPFPPYQGMFSEFHSNIWQPPKIG